MRAMNKKKSRDAAQGQLLSIFIGANLEVRGQIRIEGCG
jgi:hypothetical protein